MIDNSQCGGKKNNNKNEAGNGDRVKDGVMMAFWIGQRR